MNYRIYIFILVPFLFSCDEFFENTVTIELPPHVPELALSAAAEVQDTSILASLTITKSLEDQTISEIINFGDIKLLEDGNLFTTFEYIPGTGDINEPRNLAIYNADFPMKLKFYPTTYTIVASANDYPEIRATESIQPPAIITEAVFEEEAFIDIEGDKIDEIEVTIEDDPNMDNYYLLSIIYVNKEFMYEDKIYIQSFDPRLKEVNQDLLFEDRLFEAQKTISVYPNIFQEPSDSDLDSLRIELYTISEAGYRYSVNIEAAAEAEGNPFAEPVFVRGNIDNGAGIFLLSSKFSRTIAY